MAKASSAAAAAPTLLAREGGQVRGAALPRLQLQLALRHALLPGQMGLEQLLRRPGRPPGEGRARVSKAG